MICEKMLCRKKIVVKKLLEVFNNIVMLIIFNEVDMINVMELCKCKKD